MFHHYRSIILAVILFAGISLSAAAQSTPAFSIAAEDNTAFNFQGHLANNGVAVDGSCDFTFSLFANATGGARIGPIVTAPALAVTQGVFQAALDFGYEPLNGGERWIEINTRCPANTGAFVTLAPRQRVQSVPYALTAMTGRDGFTVHGDMWVNGFGIFGAPGENTSLSLRSPDVYLNADTSFGRGDGGRALVHEADDVLVINHTGDFSGGVRIDSGAVLSGSLVVKGNDLEMHGEASRGDGGRALVHWLNDTLVLNFGNDFAGGVAIDGDVLMERNLTVAGDTLALLGNDLLIAGDSSRGNGGRALAHSGGDVLSINHQGDFDGGVQIVGPLVITGATTINNPDLIFAGNDIKMYGSADRGDGGRALTHLHNDTLYINYAHDFSGGTVIDSDVRVIKDFQVEGNTIRLLGNDFYMQGDADRGNGGRALVHTVEDTLAINYEGDFAGGVHITGLRTGGIIEENLMSPSGAAPDFQRGDVLCWDGDTQALAYCTEAASPLVIAVADSQGRPLVFGAEPVNVLGPVQPGDLLVAAATPGYAIAWSQIGEGAPPPGTVIAKALAPLSAESGQIQAFIMVQ